MPDDKVADEKGDRASLGKAESADAGSGAIVVYATFPSEAEALATAEALVGAGLVACANIVPGISSVFIWEGRLEREREFAILMKTRRALADDVIAAVKAMHSYDNPAIVAWPLTAGSADYLSWIGEQTAAPRAITKPRSARPA